MTYYADNVDATGPYFLSRIVSNSVIDASYFANHYHVGSHVTVYYDQSNPHNSAIVRGFAPAHYADIIILILMTFSFSMAILFYNKNPFLPDISTTPEKIILSEIVQFVALLFTAMVTITILLVYYVFMIFADTILVTLVVYILNGVVILFHILNVSEELLTIFLYGLFVLVTFLLYLMLAKGFYSLWIKRTTKYPYTTTYKNIERDPNTDKWILTVEGSYKKSDESISFTHVVKKKFQSEEAADKFYYKSVYQPDYTRETNSYIINDIDSKRPKLKGFQKGLYLKKNQNSEDKTLILGYEIFSNFLLLLMPTLFVLFDFTFILLDNYKDFPYNVIKIISYYSF